MATPSPSRRAVRILLALTLIALGTAFMAPLARGLDARNSTSTVTGTSSTWCTWQVAVTGSAARLAPAWQAGTPYLTGQVVSNGGNAYRCTVAGTSAGSGGPTGTSATAVTDNTVTWVYVSYFVNGVQIKNLDASATTYIGPDPATTTSTGEGILAGSADSAPFGVSPAAIYIVGSSNHTVSVIGLSPSP